MATVTFPQRPDDRAKALCENPLISAVNDDTIRISIGKREH